ncbi:MAG: 6-carboxytetrahydropterin synthase QueD [Deltaproteobacteria bacterium]
MYEVRIVVGFSAAHRLRDYKGKCEHLHGHNYKVDVRARSERTGEGGMVIDFGELKEAARPILEKLDHSFLNDIEPFDRREPSAENIAAFIFDEIEQELGERAKMLHSVSVWESDTGCATYMRDPD